MNILALLRWNNMQFEAKFMIFDLFSKEDRGGKKTKPPSNDL